MPLINYKIHLELSWPKDCVMYGADSYADGDNANNRETTFKITSTKLYVPVVTLSTKDNVNLTKQLNEGFKKPVCWNDYKSEIETKEINENRNSERFPLDASFQGVNRLFVLAFDNTNDANRIERNSHRRHFLPRANVTNCNVLIDGRNFYDQSFNHLIKQYDEIRKIATGQGDDYTTVCLLDHQYFRDRYKLIAVDISKQK